MLPLKSFLRFPKTSHRLSSAGSPFLDWDPRPVFLISGQTPFPPYIRHTCWHTHVSDTQQHTQRQHNKWRKSKPETVQLLFAHRKHNTTPESFKFWLTPNGGGGGSFGVFQIHFPSKGPSYFCIQEIKVMNPRNHLFLCPPPQLSVLIWTSTPSGWNLTLSPIVNTFPGFSEVPACSVIRSVCWPCWHDSCRFFCVAVVLSDCTERTFLGFQPVWVGTNMRWNLFCSQLWPGEQHLESSSVNGKINIVKQS